MTWPLIETLEAASGGLLLLLAGASLYRSFHGKPPDPAPEVLPEIVDALSIYLGGNRDSGRLRVLAAAHPVEVRETLLRYQTVVAGRREELCELTIVLGYVQQWCRETHSTKLETRRKAFSCISAVSYYEPVRRQEGNIPSTAFQDPDEQIRLHAARILLSAGESAEIVRVFEAVLSDTASLRQMLAAELGRHALLLCQAAVPQALRSKNQREALQLLVSWERALPFEDVRALAEHSDPEIRADVMRLMPFLPATVENRLAILAGLADENHGVRAAATFSAGRLRIPNLGSVASPAPDEWLEMAPAGGVVGLS